MNFHDYLARLRTDPDYQDQIAAVEKIPPRTARYGEPDVPLSPKLDLHLAAQGITKLYSHQAAALNAAQRGDHVLAVTATASGKTLCYNLPVLEAALRDPRARALYLFPTKALAQDQQNKLNEFGLFPTVRYATYDGDTPKADRAAIRRGAHIVLTNPDMLHIGILPNHSMWTTFFMNLRYIVIDEIHTCKGVYGAHVAQIIRRLRRLCRQYGANPQFIACSATIANPAAHMQAVTGVAPTVIQDDGAPHGKRTFVFWNPPFAGEDGQRRSTNIEATALFTRLVEDNIRTIAFAKARKSAELILRYARQSFESSLNPSLSGRIMSYRAGFTPEERRGIERGLFDGSLIGVTATNALELGVDVGGLDATVLTGYPGSIASAWQQAGRSGRSGGEALSILVAMDNPLDQFLMRHPEYFFGRPSEQAIVNPNNSRILNGHLACAANEFPLSEADFTLFGPQSKNLVEWMEIEGTVTRRMGPSGERFYYRGDASPASRINIRSASTEAYEIRDITRLSTRSPFDTPYEAQTGSRDEGFETAAPPPPVSGRGRLIGTSEGARVYHTLHPGAIYLHQGETYRVEALDERTRVAEVVLSEANYYTETRDNTQISILTEKDQRYVGESRVVFGEVVVSAQVLGYRCKQLYGDRVLDIVDLDLPEQVFETEAFWFTVPPPLAIELATTGLSLPGAIHAAEHALIGMMPLLASCDRWDIGGVSYPLYPETHLATVFIYDGHPGGVGIAEAAYARLNELLETTRQMIEDCPCADGCPSCIQSPKCGNNNEPLDKCGAALLLKRILRPLSLPA